MSFITAYGTQVYRLENGSVIVVPPGETVPQGAERIHEVKNITIRFPLDEPVTVDLEIFPGQVSPVRGKPRWLVRHPDGSTREIKMIEFTDGGRWSDGEDR